jgi:tetratricopeptide (TPR) repeat protein
VSAWGQEQQTDPFVQGVELVRSGQYPEAEAALQQAVEAAPDNGPAWYYLGIARFRQDNLSGALEALNKARDLNPGRPGPMLYIGQVYEKQGAYAEALRAYERELGFRRGQDEAEVHNSIGRTYFLLEQYNQAIETCLNTLREEPRFVESMYWLARCYAHLKKFDAAERVYKHARDTLIEWQDAKRRLEHTPTVESEAQRQAADEPAVAQTYHWAEQFASVLAMWPELNKSTGNMYLAWERFPEARNAYRKALERSEAGNPDDPDAYVLISIAHTTEGRRTFEKDGAVYASIGIFADAIKMANKAIELNSKFAPAYAALGRVYFNQARSYSPDPERKVTSHNFGDAIEQYKKSLDLDGNYIPALTGIALAYLSLGDQKGAGTAEASQAYSEAVRHLEKAATLAPRDPDVHALLSRAYLASDRTDEALAEAEEAIRLNPSDHIALNDAGSVYYYRGDLTSAAEYFSRAIKAKPDYIQSYINLGNTYFQMQSWHSARQAYQKALQLEPSAKIANTAAERARLLYSIALCYDHTQAYDQEIDALSNAVYLDGSFFEAYLQLARAYEPKAQWRAAEQALRVAAQKAESDPDRVRAYVRLGEVLERAGKPSEAVAAYTAAANLDPNNPAAQQALQRLRTHASTTQ